MRLGVIGESLIERIVLRTNMAPDPLAETQIAYSMARSIMAGVKLGLFDSIGTEAKTAAEVAALCGTDEEATTKLMNALVGCRYLRHRDGQYELAPKARKWLLRSSPHSIRDKLLFQYDEWDIVSKYEEYIASGQPLEIHRSLTDRLEWNRYQRGMRALASISAEEVAARLPVPAGATAMLDIGGSHGYYSVCLCRKHDALRSTILDLPQAVEHAAPILAEEGMGERVVHRAGDALSDELGNEDWDVVFMSQLVHHFTDEQNRNLVRRIARALKPGGICVLLDMLRPSSPESVGGFGAVLDLYFAATSRSGTWPLETIRSWQRDAGLSVGRPIQLRTLPGAAMVVGRRPSGSAGLAA
ncbi:MAG TPA: class I SAM-dependent methyltransferase [Vicinamibacteria bacterium]|nr:class I SAM-dependent methyltransferase [Vicinamibacteria bacterium]